MAGMLAAAVWKIVHINIKVVCYVLRRIRWMQLGAHKGTNISFAPPIDMVAMKLQVVVEENFTFGNRGKNELVDLLLAWDDSLLISYDGTWQEIYLAIGTIEKMKICRFEKDNY